VSRYTKSSDPRACTLSDDEISALADRLFELGTCEQFSEQPRLAGVFRQAAAIRTLLRRLRV
jgi:hypothetical protein